MSNLKPCPFCGSYNLVEGYHSPFVICDDCGAFGPGHADMTHDEAIAAWNTRTDDYERAAEYWQRMYEQTFAERTCHDTGKNEWHFVCSACGYEQNGYECWNYCPNCGAKVVK